MPTKIDIKKQFLKRANKLARKYRGLLDDIDALIVRLKNDERPGDKIPTIGHDVYKSAPCQSIGIKRQKWRVSGHLLCTTW